MRHEIIYYINITTLIVGKCTRDHSPARTLPDRIDERNGETVNPRSGNAPQRGRGCCAGSSSSRDDAKLHHYKVLVLLLLLSLSLSLSPSPSPSLSEVVVTRAVRERVLTTKRWLESHRCWCAMYILPDRIMYATGRENGRMGGMEARTRTSRGVHKTRTGRIGQGESESDRGGGKRDRR